MDKAFRAGLPVIALFLAALNLRLAINSISPILESLQQELEMSASLASLLTAIPVLCMGLFSLLAAKMAARWGLEKVIGLSLILIAVGTVIRLFADTAMTLLLTAFVAGVGIASVGPLLSGFIKRYFPANVPSMIAVYTLALTIGAALASGLSAPLQTAFGSWQGALAIWGVFGIIAIWIWLVLLRRVAQQANSSALPQAVARIPWRNRQAWYLTVTFGLLSMLFYAVTAWLPPIVQSMGYSHWYAGNVLTVFAVVQIPAGFMVRLLLNRYPSRLFWLSAAAIIELAGFLLLMLSVQPLLAAMLIGLGAGTLFPLNLMLPIDMTGNAQEAASWAAMTQSVGYVIGATGPIFLGWIHDMTQSFAWAIAGLMIMNIVMIGVQTMAVPGKFAGRVETVAKG